jgi:hypothetical protein
MNFTYKVTVTVPDEPAVLGEDYSRWEDVFFDDPDAPAQVSSQSMAGIVMAERLGCDEDYGFDYRVNYEALPDGVAS